MKMLLCPANEVKKSLTQRSTTRHRALRCYRQEDSPFGGPMVTDANRNRWLGMRRTTLAQAAVRAVFPSLGSTSTKRRSQPRCRKVADLRHR